MGKNKYKKLLEEIKASFRAELEKRDERIKELERENALLRYELQQLKDRWSKPKPPKKDEPSRSEPKKKGVHFGHFGWFRKKPEKIDKVEIVTLKRCPICNGRNLTECQEKEEHTQEDIILPRVEATKYIRYHYYCEDCEEIVSGKGEEEIPRSYIGPKAKAIANFLRYDIKISFDDIQRIFRDLFNLKIVPSSIHGFNNQLRDKAFPIYDGIKKKVRCSKFCHADETGWKLDGENHWLWSFSNRRVSFFHIDKSRGQKVVKEILGDKYNGILISDFLSAYNKVRAKAKQRCIVHLKRDLDKVLACSDDESIKRYSQTLLELLKQAEELAKDYKDKKLDREYFERRREMLANRLEDFNFPDPGKRHLKRLSQRLIRHKQELLTFLYHPNISSNNNHAERQLRHNVIFRKITFGNRSPRGALNHGVLMSILQTAKLNNLDPLMIFKKLFILPAEKRSVELLIPP